MEFYQAIAHRYDYIFPYSPKQKEFVLSGLDAPEASDLLEIGCATGSLTLELAKHCHSITGLDIDESLISFARKKAALSNDRVEICEMDMLGIAESFSPASFDGICSFGNTVVHLDDKDKMLDLFRSVKTLLKEAAPFHIQIINYDRILDEHMSSLPTIENEVIQFVRRYQYLEDEHRIEFSTTLTDKQTGTSSSGMVRLYPLRQKELEELLREAGFSKLAWFGGFDRSSLERTSIPLILTAQ